MCQEQVVKLDWIDWQVALAIACRRCFKGTEQHPCCLQFLLLGLVKQTI